MALSITQIKIPFEWGHWGHGDIGVELMYLDVAKYDYSKSVS